MAYLLRDEILAPRNAIVIEYSGPNPFSVFGKIDQLFKTIFEAKGTNMFEDDFRWDVSADPNPFFFKYAVKRRLDKWTGFEVKTKVQGAQPKDKTKSGWVKIEISGTLQTEVPIQNQLVRAIWMPFFYAYMVAYYAKVRRRYIQSLNRGIESLEAELRTFFKIPVRA